jgi:hypothetical protein
MKTEKMSTAPTRHWPFAAGVLVVILAVLFFKGFLPGYVHFSNDGPLGQQMQAWLQPSQMLTGGWDDMNYIGSNGGAFAPGVSPVLHMLFGPVGFSKFFAPISLFILGFGAWTFFNQLRLSRLAAILGALGVALNSAYFSTACWGVASQQIAAGFDFMALALVVSITPAMPPLIRWTRIVLAGMAVGMNVMEAADIGALYSIFVAAFVCYHAWFATEGSAVVRISRGAGRVALIAFSAVLIAAFAVTNLVGIGIKGVAGAQQDTRTKQEQWDWATQWSFPKRETLALVIPGLYGFRMDSPEGANYWGVGGRDPKWWRYFENGKQGPPPQGFMRQAGGGCYMGVTAVLLALWAAAQAFRKKSVFTPVERKLVWFWAAALAVSLLLAYGRFAPFFQFVYAIPYASTIRNPGKFLAIFTFSTTVLAAYGIHGLCRGYLETPLQNISGSGSRLKSWWAKASTFDKRWTIGCFVAIGASLAGWFIYAQSQHSLEQYLQEVQFDEALSSAIAAFSVRQVGWYVLFLSLGVGMITLIMCGAFAGRRAKAGGVLLGILLVADLGRANLPWIKPIDYKEKNATNPIIEFLRDKPYEHRVAILPFSAPSQFALFDQLYRIEWAQHQFPYNNIQSLDIIQMPRMPEDLAAFEGAISMDGTSNTAYRVCRRWELTNTRYLLGAAGFLDVLNQQLDPAKRRFRIAKSFDVVPRPGVTTPTRLEELTAAVNPNGSGQYALFEFTGALPRARLYSHWQINTNDQATLKLMGSESFDPAQTVLVAGGVSTAASSPATNQNSGTVDFASYAPKDIKLKTKSDAAAVLLLNDKYDPSWQVFVDGKRAELLRCNFLMRGVQVPAGEHAVEFHFKPDVGYLYVSVAGVGLAVILLGVVAFHAKSQRT